MTLVPDDDWMLAQGTVDARVQDTERHKSRCDECGAVFENCYCGEHEDFMDDLDCTHCGGEGDCDANANPLWDCDDQFHPCHACGGSGKRRDQTIF